MSISPAVRLGDARKHGIDSRAVATLVSKHRFLHFDSPPLFCSSSKSGLSSRAAIVHSARIISDTDFFGMQSEVTRFQMAMLANNHVKQNYAGLFTFDPIGRIEEWRTAMLADPSHT
jgi:hypothetical protein